MNKLYAGRLAALYPSPQDFKWWQTDDRSNRDERRDRERKRRDLNEEKRALVKELLGVDLETEMAKWEGRPDDDAWRTGFLSAEKQQAVQAWQEKFREMERTAFAEMRENRGSPEARAKMLALRAQREAELAQILGPQDFQEYQLRNSATARDMRDSLGSFSPSEDEFKKIFELRENFEQPVRVWPRRQTTMQHASNAAQPSNSLTNSYRRRSVSSATRSTNSPRTIAIAKSTTLPAGLNLPRKRRNRFTIFSRPLSSSANRL